MPGTTDGLTVLIGLLPTRTGSNPCRSALCMEWRLPFRGGAEHDGTACGRDSPLGEEQSTTERRAPIAGLTVLIGLLPTRTGSNPFFRSFLKIFFCCHVDSCPAEILYSSSGSLLIFSALNLRISPFLLKQICVRVSDNDILW